MARSVAELLPRRFADLTIHDVREIIANIGEERETLFFERKASVTGNALAKACSAFANTYGGLLVVGVADDSDALSGIEPPATEAQLWVKDTLRSLVLPMPPFRARWLPTEGDRGVLIVLVEESATTPHLLTRSGAIYVRNPGSSDPVPIGDQRRLLDLTARGERAIEHARAAARAALSISFADDTGIYTSWEPTEVLALAPSGVGVGFDERVFDETTPADLDRLTWGPPEQGNRRRDSRIVEWGQHQVGVRRILETPLSHRYRAHAEAVVLRRNGVVVIARGYLASTDSVRELGPLHDNELRPHLSEKIRAARNILAEYGGHGDLRLAYRLDLLGRGLFFESVPNLGAYEFDEPLIVEVDTTFDDDTVENRVFNEVLRAAGVGPLPSSSHG